jgi:hypothetical protein
MITKIINYFKQECPHISKCNGYKLSIAKWPCRNILYESCSTYDHLQAKKARESRGQLENKLT